MRALSLLKACTSLKISLIKMSDPALWKTARCLAYNEVVTGADSTLCCREVARCDGTLSV